jgi:hypothetical protein
MIQPQVMRPMTQTKSIQSPASISMSSLPVAVTEVNHGCAQTLL